MKFRPLALRAVVMACALLAPARPALAWSFYWSKVNVKSSSWQDCMSFSYGAAQNEHLQKIQRNNLDITGYLNGNLATLTCIGTGGNSPAMAVVMVVGDTE